MRNNRPLALLLLACCLVQPALGQVSFGSADCGQWIKRTDSVGIKNHREAWLVGYMSGLNKMNWVREPAPSGDPWSLVSPLLLYGDPLHKVNSAEQMLLWMDNYCNKNPLSNISIGGFELFRELELMKR